MTTHDRDLIDVTRNRNRMKAHACLNFNRALNVSAFEKDKLEWNRSTQSGGQDVRPLIRRKSHLGDLESTLELDFGNPRSVGHGTTVPDLNRDSIDFVTLKIVQNQLLRSEPKLRTRRPGDTLEVLDIREMHDLSLLRQGPDESQLIEARVGFLFPQRAFDTRSPRLHRTRVGQNGRFHGWKSFPKTFTLCRSIECPERFGKTDIERLAIDWTTSGGSMGSSFKRMRRGGCRRDGKINIIFRTRGPFHMI